MDIDRDKILAAISSSGLPEDEQRQALELLIEIERKGTLEAAKTEFIPFVRAVWPAFIAGAHHKKMAEAFERVARGELKRLIINMPPRHTKPLNINEKISLWSGSEKKLGDIEVGDVVLTHKGRGRKVLAVHEQGKLPTVRVELCNGRHVDAAPDHPFLTENGWVNAGNLLGRSVRMIPEEERTGGNTDLFMLAGYLTGDGSIGWARGGRAQKASITCSDKEELSDIKGICERLGITINKGSSKSEWHFSGGYSKGRTGSCNTWVRNRGEFSIREWLLENDMVGSAAEKHVPDFVKRGTRNQIAAFLGSYFACDGTVANRRGKYSGLSFGFTTISKRLAEDTHSLLLRLGVDANLREVKTQIVYKGVRKFGVAYTVSITNVANAEKLYEEIGPYIRHEKRSRMPLEIDSARLKAKPRAAYSGFVKVKSVSAVEDAECRCLEVEEDHTFVCGDMVVHNSEFASNLFPAWYLGQFPEKKVIQASHTAELAVKFGRQVRNMLDTEEYRRIFPNTKLSADSKAAGRWNTSKRGEYFAVGVDSAVAGKGADILVIDDPHDEQEAKTGEWNPAVYDRVYDWYTSGPRQRLQPGGSIIIVMTRWSLRDLTGQILKKAGAEDALDEWEVIEFPAILPSGKALWPEFWKLEDLEKIKRDIEPAKWNAQYQQNPTSEEGAIIKREGWKEWNRERPPQCDAIIQSWDTAFEKTQRSDYSACTTWGIFQHPDASGRMQPNLIMLHAFKDKLEFPELKRKAYELYNEFEPDQLVIERKASGAPLLMELRSMGIPVADFVPVRGNDKISRANAVTDLFASGVVWAPVKNWAYEVIEECAAFPSGEHDDYVDSTTQALLRFRQGGWIRAELDDYDDEPLYREPVEYY